MKKRLNQTLQFGLFSQESQMLMMVYLLGSLNEKATWIIRIHNKMLERFRMLRRREDEAL